MATTAQASATISGSPEQVWALLVDPARYGEWVAGHQALNGTAPTELTAGSGFGQTIHVMGMPAAIQWTVNEASAPSRLTMSGSGPMGIDIESVATVTAADDGSRVEIAYTFSGGAVFMVAAQLEREVSSTLAQSLTNLATLV